VAQLWLIGRPFVVSYEVFITLAFVRTIPLAGLASGMVTQWLPKSVHGAAVTTLTGELRCCNH